MDTPRWDAIKSAFDSIVEVDDVERASRLRALRVSDHRLCVAVELLLAADSDADARLSSLDAVFFPRSAPGSDPLGLAGRTVSHFEVREVIGAGGIGVVYRAEDTRLGRAVALKFLLPSHGLDSSAKARFLREAHLVAALDHPNLCTVHDVGTSDDGRFFLAMPLYEGETLKARMGRDRAMPVGDVLEIARQVTEGLRCAHEAGIVHRDLKPGNLILLPDGTVKVLDFGLAKARDQSQSEVGARIGTVSYMSPEQIRGAAVDGRADLWAVGVVLYEMLTGRKPFGGEEDISVAHAILHDEPFPCSTLRDDLPAALEDLVLMLLEKDPARRYATASDLLRDLSRIDPAVPRTNGWLRTLRRTAGMPRRLSGSSRAWIPVAIGGIAVAATATALILSPTPGPERPDQVQLTFTGNAIAPSLSDDGTRMAFAEKQCDTAGYCTYQLVIQDTDGTDRVVMVRNIGYIYATQWISNDRYLEFAGSYPPLRHGAFAVSTLGGEPRYLGCCTFHLISGDTALLAVGSMPGVDRAWVRRITVHDGRTLDSIPIWDHGAAYHIVALGIPDRFIVAVRKTLASVPEFRLTDFRGRVIDRLTPSFWSLDRIYPDRWLPSRQKLVVASRRTLDPAFHREWAGTEFDMFAMNVTASRIEPDIDTVFSGLQLGNGLFDVSADGKRLVYSSGPVETMVSTIDVDRVPASRLAITQVWSSTTLVRGRISPAGDRILIARDAPQSGRNVSQFSLISRNGGEEWQLPGTVPGLLGSEWSPDGSRIMYSHRTEGNEIRLTERDTTGQVTREIVRLEQAPAHFHPVADGAVSTIPEDRRSISVIRRRGKRDVTWHVPDWMSGIGSISPSPDGNSIAVEGMNRSFDSVVVATVNIESGHFTRLGSFAGSDPQKITWLDDGRIMFVLREKQGAFALYAVNRGLSTVRLGVLPYTQADFSVSKDGKYVAAFGYSDKKDVYMIRNFGNILRR